MFTFAIRNDLYNPTFDQVYLLAPWIFDLVTLSRPCLLMLMCKQMQVAFIVALNKGKFMPTFVAGGNSTTLTTSNHGGHGR